MRLRRGDQRATTSDLALGVHPIDCHAHGLCAELLPEMITLDEWGYPLLADSRVPAALVRQARRAAAACPTLALRLGTSPTSASRHGPGHGGQR